MGRFLSLGFLLLFAFHLFFPATAEAKQRTRGGQAHKVPTCENIKNKQVMGKMDPKHEEMLRKRLQQSKLTTANDGRGVLPEELDSNCSGQAEEAWFGIMKYLARAESQYNHCTPSWNNGEDSHGLYQMTYGDTALGKKCFDKPEEVYDAEKNIDCAVRKMEELVDDKRGPVAPQKTTYKTIYKTTYKTVKGKGGKSYRVPVKTAVKVPVVTPASQGGPSLRRQASKYWGPFKSVQYDIGDKGGKIVSDAVAGCSAAKRVELAKARRESLQQLAAAPGPQQ